MVKKTIFFAFLVLGTPFARTNQDTLQVTIVDLSNFAQKIKVKELSSFIPHAPKSTIALDWSKAIKAGKLRELVALHYNTPLERMVILPVANQPCVKALLHNNCDNNLSFAPINNFLNVHTFIMPKRKPAIFKKALTFKDKDVSVFFA